MTKADLLIERGADRLEQLSRKAAAKGGLAASLAGELAEDAAFLRKLKPSLIKARAKGRAPIADVPEWEPRAPSAPQVISPRRKPRQKNRHNDRGPQRGPNPFLVAGIALAAGIAIAKVIDWRSHAHPRD
jgi:hypothetical protein